jgi:hypothetical protein
MAKRVTDLTELDSLASDDLLVVVDTSDTSSSAVGTSKKITMDNVIYTKTIDLDNTQLQGITSEYTLIAGESGYAIIPLSFILQFNYVSTTETSKRNFFLGYTGVSTSKYFYQGTGLMHNISDTSIYTASIGGSNVNAVTTIDNKGIVCLSNTAYANDMTLTVYATYKKYKI